jgi:iron complex transport system substrate-binding protein
MQRTRVIGLLGLILATSIANANEVERVPDAKRVVAVGGSITEIVYALGEERRLVARDSTSLFPEAALALPDVGYMRQLPTEGVMSVDPDAILLLEGSGPPEAIEVLKKASVPLVAVPERFSREGILEKVKAVGHALGVDAKAAALSATLDAEIAAAEKMAAEAKTRKRVLFILSTGGGKILASGEGTAANGIITMAGGENVMSAFKGYKQITDEAIITAAPEVILMMDRGDHGSSDEQLLSHPALAETPAGKAKRVIRMDGTYLIGFGPRTAGAVKDLAAALATP